MMRRALKDCSDIPEIPWTTEAGILELENESFEGMAEGLKSQPWCCSGWELRTVVLSIGLYFAAQSAVGDAHARSKHPSRRE